MVKIHTIDDKEKPLDPEDPSPPSDDDNSNQNFGNQPRRIRTLRDNRPHSIRDPPGDPSALRDSPNWDTLSFKTNEPPLDPLNESFFYMLRANFCPLLTWLSFTAFLTLLLMITFAIQLKVDGLEPQPKEFLMLNDKGATSKWGTTNYDKIKKHNHYYRLFVSLFLHSSFAHVVSNILMVIIWGSFLEGFLKPFRTACIFLLSGIYGNVMSAIASGGKYESLGASTGIFGYFGAGFGYLIVNWTRMKHYRSPRGTVLCVLLIVTLLNFIFAPSDVAIVSHLGGFLGGLLCSLFLTPLYTNPYKKDDPEHLKRGGCDIAWIVIGVVSYLGSLGGMIAAI